jgi:hypothetical protein
VSLLRRGEPARLADATTGDVEDFYLTRNEAETVLVGILADEPDFKGTLWIEAVEFETSPN